MKLIGLVVASEVLRKMLSSVEPVDLNFTLSIPTPAIITELEIHRYDQASLLIESRKSHQLQNSDQTYILLVPEDVRTSFQHRAAALGRAPGRI